MHFFFSKNNSVTHPSTPKEKNPNQIEAIKTYCSFSFDWISRLLMIRLLQLAVHMTVDVTDLVANKVLK